MTPEERLEHKRQWRRQYREANRERIAAYEKEYREKNWETLKVKRREHANASGKGAENARKYRERHPEKAAAMKAASHKKRMERDPQYALARKLRVRLSNAFRSQGAQKDQTTLSLTGCSIPELIAHLSARFTEGMTLENYGEWVIDHIVPVGAFNLHDPLHRVICFHYSNLQPLWRADNLRKVKRDKALIAAARLAQSRL